MTNLRPQTLVSLVDLMLENESQLPPSLVTQLREFTTNSRAQAISDADPRKYIRVAAAIIDDIRTGALKPGDQLPARDQLAARFGVSVTTCKKAVYFLARREVVELRSNAYWVRSADDR